MGRQRKYEVDESHFNEEDQPRKRTAKRKVVGLWPRTAIISDEGKQIIEQDQAMSEKTLNDLISADRELIDPETMAHISTMTNREIAGEVFGTFDEIGLAHMALCIAENPKQTLAQLIIQYSDDRRIPVVLGAIYVNAFLAAGGHFFYYDKSSISKAKILWNPGSAPAEAAKTIMPPTKQKGEPQPEVVATKKMNELGLKLDPCPHCGSATTVTLFDSTNQFFAVACNNPRCEMASGIRPLAPFQKAIDMYKEYRDSFIEDPPMVDPGEYITPEKPKTRRYRGAHKKATRIRKTPEVPSEDVSEPPTNVILADATAKDTIEICEEALADVSIDAALASENVVPSIPPAKKTRKS